MLAGTKLKMDTMECFCTRRYQLYRDFAGFVISEGHVFTHVC